MVEYIWVVDKYIVYGSYGVTMVVETFFNDILFYINIYYILMFSKLINIDLFCSFFASHHSTHLLIFCQLPIEKVLNQGDTLAECKYKAEPGVNPGLNINMSYICVYAPST